MSTTTFTLDDILKMTHRKAEGNVDYPTSGEDDYTLRLGLINDYISVWEREEGTLWNELWKVASFASTGATSYALSSSVADMRFPGGYVEVVDTSGASLYWDVIPVEEVRLKTNNGDRYCYFTGDPQNGFTLYFNTNQYPSGGTIKFPYYKKANWLANASDKPEMSDPMYLVHAVTSDLKSSDDPGESDKQWQLAQSRLRAMKTLNLMDAPWTSSRVEDRSAVRYGSGFGS